MARVAKPIRADDLDGDLFAIRIVRPHGEINGAHPTAGDGPDDLIRTDRAAGLDRLRSPLATRTDRCPQALGGVLQKTGIGVVSGDEGFRLGAQRHVVSAGFQQKCAARSRVPFESRFNDVL
jgi:hypothetical protein